MATKKQISITITPPNFKLLAVRVEGISPLMMHKFSEKMRKQIQEKQTSQDATRKKREPKDYTAEFNAARYRAMKGKWDGIPAGSFRAAMISACRGVDGLPMTRAKSAFFILADGQDETDGTPLVRIHGEAQHDTRPVRLESGVADLRNRPRYDDWACELKINYDADLLSPNDVANLLSRAGTTVGVGEMRPQAPNSCGSDFGMWRVVESKIRSAA